MSRILSQRLEKREAARADAEAVCIEYGRHLFKGNPDGYREYLVENGLPYRRARRIAQETQEGARDER